MTLEAGNYWYQFNVILPPNIPSSFESFTGYIRYTIQSTFDKPWKFDHYLTNPFTVVGILDLNMQLPVLKVKQQQHAILAFKTTLGFLSPIMKKMLKSVRYERVFVKLVALVKKFVATTSECCGRLNPWKEGTQETKNNADGLMEKFRVQVIRHSMTRRARARLCAMFLDNPHLDI